MLVAFQGTVSLRQVKFLKVSILLLVNFTKAMLEDLVESGRAVEGQLDALKDMNMKMEEEIQNLKQQKVKDDENLRSVQNVSFFNVNLS